MELNSGIVARSQSPRFSLKICLKKSRLGHYLGLETSRDLFIGFTVHESLMFAVPCSIHPAELHRQYCHICIRIKKSLNIFGKK